MLIPLPVAGDEILDPSLFPVPEVLRPNVEFWTRVYTEYTSDQVLLHDDRHLDVVYAMLDFTRLEASSLSDARKSQLRKQEISRAKRKYAGLLGDLARGRRAGEDHARVEKLLASVPGGRDKYTAAISRLRTQRCLRDQFAEGIERSGIYMDAMEGIFRHYGLPVELTRLPFVESLFQWHARSSVAAGGIWQFMPATGRMYLKMDLEYDERFAPLRATDAAARLLRDNYAALRTWPLAITAYNHGRGGMQRAVRRLGTRDFGTIATRYRSRTFGFASRNFYSEFIAAARIYAQRERYFPGVEPLPPLAYEEFRPERYVPLRDLAARAGTDLDMLRQMNPALSSEVWAGNLYLPRGYELLVPRGRGDDFRAAYAALPSSRKLNHQVGQRYRVRRGDTLSKIAARFGVSVGSIQRANRLTSPHRIRVGQNLRIPPGGRASAAPAVARSNGGVHVVRRGETLTAIADAYGTTVRALMSVNSIRSPHRIYVGQRLRVPTQRG